MLLFTCTWIWLLALVLYVQEILVKYVRRRSKKVIFYFKNHNSLTFSYSYLLTWSVVLRWAYSFVPFIPHKSRSIGDSCKCFQVFIYGSDHRPLLNVGFLDRVWLRWPAWRCCKYWRVILSVLCWMQLGLKRDFFLGLFLESFCMLCVWGGTES